MDAGRVVRVAIALGSNEGERLGTLRAAGMRLRDELQNVKMSSVWRSEPTGIGSNRPFLNACIIGCTRERPRPLMECLLSLELALGRRRPGPADGRRRIDLDLLLYDQRIIAEQDLVLPHPRMRERAFVLHPLNEIAPDWAVPRVGSGGADSVAELTARVGTAGVKRVHLPDEWS